MLVDDEQTTDEAAFEASFAEARGEPAPAAPVPQADPAPHAAEPDPVDPEPVVADEPGDGDPPELPAEPPRLIAGLTEAQLQEVLARNSSLQGTVDKLAGRFGTLMQQVEALKAAPAATPQQQQALDLKLEKLSGSFPELANLLREDLQSMGAPITPAEPAPPATPAAPVLTQADLDAALAATTAKVNEQVEVRVLSVVHPDWTEVIRTPQFALYRDSVLPAGEGQKLMESEDAAYISEKLTAFKAWRTAAAEPAPVVPAPQGRKTNRLANAVLPSGGAQPAPSGAISEDDAFQQSFKAEQSRRGY